MQDVRPLKAQRAACSRARARRPRARFARAERAAVLQREPAGARARSVRGAARAMSCCFAAPACPETVLRRLRRGMYRVEGEIDLHGLTAPRQRCSSRTFCAWRSAPRACAACASFTARACAPGSAGRCSRNRSTRCCAEPIRCWPSPRHARSPAAPARHWCCCKRAESRFSRHCRPSVARSARSPSRPALRCGR